MNSTTLMAQDKSALRESGAKTSGGEKTKTVAQERSYIPTLDGWRAIAVSLVIGAHCQPMLLNNGSKAARLLATFFQHTGYGVDIFFALSGYLICTLLLREKQRTGTISMSRFYVRRVFRILPPMLVYLGFVVLLSRLAIIPFIPLPEISAVLFFFRNYVGGTWYTGHFWSLAVEEQFYAVVPLVLLLVNKRWAVRCASGLIALCIGVRWFEYSHGMFAGSLLQFRTENRFDGLLWGALLAVLLQNASFREWLRKWLNWWVAAAVLVVAFLLLVEFTSQPARRTIVAAAIPFLIAYTVLHADSLAGRFLELPLLKWVGRLSYSLYIWQMMFLVEADRPLGLVQAFPLDLILPLVCAALSYYLLEKPMIKLGHRLAGSPGAKPTGRMA